MNIILIIVVVIGIVFGIYYFINKRKHEKAEEVEVDDKTYTLEKW